MAKKTKKKLSKNSEELIILRWEYLRRNNNFINDYDNLINLTNHTVDIPLNKIKNHPYGKMLITSILHFMKKWSFSPESDPLSPLPIFPYDDPTKEKLAQLANTISNGLINGIRIPKSKGVKCLSELPGYMFKNDITKKGFENKIKIQKLLGKMPDRIKVEINLNNPREIISHEFNLLLDKCFKILKFQNRQIKSKPRRSELFRNIKVYDYYQKSKSLRRTANKFFKGEDIENAKRKIQKALKRSKELINGGYLDLK